jgi:DNA-binding transcriptional regulator GbsR (MarR family)
MTLKSSQAIKDHFVSGMTRIAHFWGFPKAMGAAYAAIYLSPAPLSLDEISESVSVSKGGLVAHMRGLERLGIVRKESRVGDRKDYYIADTDFWGAVRQIVKEREKREFALALQSVNDCIESLQALPSHAMPAPARAFLKERFLAMKRFFDALDRVASILLAMDDFGVGIASRVGNMFGAPSSKKTRAKQ